MKSVRYEEYGDPAKVLKLIDAPKPEPAADEVLIRLTARSINPSDLHTIRGEYGIKPSLPATPGNEAAGVVEAVGDQVDEYKPGDRVTLKLGGVGVHGAWHEYIAVKPRGLMHTPAKLTDEQAGSAWANYLSAWVLVVDELQVKPGKTVLMTAAGSHLGRAMFQIAAHLKFDIIATVRRKEQVEEVLALGAKAVIATDTENITERVAEITKNRGVPYAIDAVGGKIGADCFAALSRAGTLILYGYLSQEPLPVDGSIIFTENTLRGFWLIRWMRRASRAHQQAVFEELSSLFNQGVLQPTVDETFPLEHFDRAIQHMQVPGRKGKVVLT